MEDFDVLVIGSGSGMIVAANAVANSMKTALVESGSIGGTCLNRGCIPSKMLIYPADLVAIIQEAGKLGIDATINSINFKRIMESMHYLVMEDVERQEKVIRADPNIKWYKGVGEFVSDYTLRVGDDRIKAERIFIVSGARPYIPPIRGLDSVDYMTSDTVLQLETPPKSMIIIGGGYIAAEYGHFFSRVGTNVTIVQRNPRILPEEEPEISDLLRKEMEKRMQVFTDQEAVEISEKDDVVTVVTKGRSNGKLRKLSAHSLLLAAGRVANADVLKPEKTGVELDKRGYVKVNERLETRKKNIWAFGDAIGKRMFKHVANYEAQIAWHNALHDHKVSMDYSTAPHAVFTCPQVASVGLKETEAKQKGYRILVGMALYKDAAQGAAMGRPEGFVKVILEQKTGKILGGHIIGSHASILIQEVINAMAVGERSLVPIIRGMHIHPSMSEVVQNAFVNLHKA
jgi:mycothione reductase